MTPTEALARVFAVEHSGFGPSEYDLLQPHHREARERHAGEIIDALVAFGYELRPIEEREAMLNDAADLTDCLHEAATLRTTLAHVLVRTHDSGCDVCDAARTFIEQADDDAS